MIKEDFVSLEVAKLLKEKGFNEECQMAWCYIPNKMNSEYLLSHLGCKNNILEEYNSPDTDYAIAAPTLQMAAKWLREEHNLSINNICSVNGFYCSVVHIVKDKSGRIIDVEDSADWETPYCKTFEEAFDKALNFCLENLI